MSGENKISISHKENIKGPILELTDLIWNKTLDVSFFMIKTT